MTQDPGIPPVVRAKLTEPRALPAQIRPSTLELTRRALQQRLTLVFAPGGYGKTTLALEALRSAGLEAAWYRVDELDCDPVVFLASITEAVSPHVPGFGERIRARLRSAPEGVESVKELVATYVTDLSDHLASTLHLVIDDYHEAIDSKGFNETLEYLLATAPEDVHFVILSRYEPAFSVSKMRVTGEITILGVEQLRLTATETQRLVEQRGGMLLDESASERLAHLTQGWPASIALAAMALQWLDFPSIEAAMSDPRLRRDVHSYLTEQVYAREKGPTQAFLLETCCLEYVSPALANEMTGRQDGHWQLQHLMANQIFTSRSEAEETCRYHPLLRDFLRQRFLQERGAEAYHQLQAASAQAMERAGDLPSAIAIYLSANEGEAALSVIARAGFGTLEDIRSETLQTWLSRLPSSLRLHPWALVLEAHLLTRSGKYEESVRVADEALSAFAETDDDEGRYQALCVKESALFWKGDNEGAREALDQALQAAHSTDERIHALIGLAAAYEGQCRWTEALTALDQAAELGRLNSNGERSRIAAHRGNILLLTGRMREADAQFLSIQETDDSSAFSLRATMLNSHGVVLLALGRYEEAHSCFREAMAVAEAQGYDFYSAMLSSCWSQVYLAVGDIELAEEMAKSAAASGLLAQDAHCLAYAYSHLGTIYRRVGKISDAHSAYEMAVQAADAGGATHALINASSNLAFTRCLSGDSLARKALQDSEQAAMSLGMNLVRCKSAFFSASNKYYSARRAEAIQELLIWVKEALDLGHLSFVSQEMCLQPDVAVEILSMEKHEGIRKSILDALVLTPSSTSVLMRLLDHSSLAGAVLQASTALPAEAREPILRRAARHRDAAVRRLIGTLGRTQDKGQGISLEGLTPREIEVLKLVAEGMHNGDIAARLFLSTSTVKTHINHIFAKLDTTSRIQAANLYRQAVERAE